MGKMLKKVEDNLIKSGRFNRDDLHLEDSEGGKVAGFVVSSEFDSLTDMERQDSLWNLLRSFLTDEETYQIIAIITVSPEEYEAYSEESVAV